MNRLFPLACLLACLFLMNSCSLKKKADDIADEAKMQTKINELEVIRDIDTLDKAEKNKLEMAKFKELIKAYPPLPPIGRDTMDRVFLANIPKAIDSYKLIAVEKKMEVPNKYDGVTEWDTKKLYFSGSVRYDDAKAKQSMALSFVDLGSTGKWYGVMNYNALMTGSDRSPIAVEFLPRIRFKKIVDHDGLRWSQWKPLGTKSKALLFSTIMNDRFYVTVVAPDITFVDKVLDKEWIKKIN